MAQRTRGKRQPHTRHTPTGPSSGLSRPASPPTRSGPVLRPSGHPWVEWWPLFRPPAWLIVHLILKRTWIRYSRSTEFEQLSCRYNPRSHPLHALGRTGTGGPGRHTSCAVCWLWSATERPSGHSRNTRSIDGPRTRRQFVVCREHAGGSALSMQPLSQCMQPPPPAAAPRPEHLLRSQHLTAP